MKINDRKVQTITSRITRLRENMIKHHINVYYVPSDDFHGSEFVSEYFKEREYMSGFRGSAGTLIVTEDMAGLFTDGRYFLQAENELTGTDIVLFKMGETGVPDINEFLFDKLEDGMTLGFDGRCVTAAKALSIQKYFTKKNKKIFLKGELDLVGDIWENRPKLPKEPAYMLALSYAGESIESKLARLREAMEKEGADSLILTSLDDIAWLLNIRGNDIKCSPMVLAYMIITVTTITFYCGNGTKEDDKLTKVYDALTEKGIQIKGYFDIYQDIEVLDKETYVIADLDKVNYRLYCCLKQDKIVDILNPTTSFKAVKNRIEIENQKKAHIRDGVAYARFLYWFKNICHKEEISELVIADRLLMERKKQEGFVSESFEPIVAYKEHGAIVHYSPTQETNCPLGNRSFVLIDTGAQYFEGTTDITRTLSCGELTEEEKRHYTLVLKANLALGNAKFLKGATGASLDMLARKPLWENGLDYNHGTGHGVGYFSNVHEGPNSIRYRVGEGKNVSIPFEAGMISSNEPGLYITNQYGIRLENMIVCVERENNAFGCFLVFDTLTLVPFELEAIIPEMLSDKEKVLLNSYHARVYKEISPYLDEEEKSCLAAMTREVALQQDSKLNAG